VKTDVHRLQAGKCQYASYYTDTNGTVSVFWAKSATIKTKLVQTVTLHPRPATFTTTSNIILFWGIWWVKMGWTRTHTIFQAAVLCLQKNSPIHLIF